MNRIKGFGLLFAALLALAACGSGGALPAAGGSAGGNDTAAQPTSAPASTNAPTTGSGITAVPAATASIEATSAPAAGGEMEVDKSRLAKELHWYNWSDYIDPSILEDFEKEYGVKVTVDLFDQNEDMLAKIRAGNSGYDLVTPSDYAVQIMAADKLLAPLDKSMLPNLQYMRKQNMDLYFDRCAPTLPPATQNTSAT